MITAPVLKPAQVRLRCEEYVLRTLAAPDLTPDYVSWFRESYVIDGLNLVRDNFTRDDHIQHIAIAARAGAMLLIAEDARGFPFKSYFKIDIDQQRSIASLTVAFDRGQPERRDIITKIIWHLVRFLTNVRKMAKVKVSINRRNIAARSYMATSQFKLEGVLRREVFYRNTGQRDDLLIYGLLAEEMTDRWAKTMPAVVPSHKI